MAAPHPEKELERLHKAAADVLPKVAVLTGPAAFFRNEAIEALIARVPPAADLRRIDGSQDTDGRELDDLRGATLFGSGTYLVVRRGESWLAEHGARLVDIVPQISKGCGLIVEVGKLDGRTKLTKTITANGAVFEFRELYAEPFDRSRSPLEAELVGWVAMRARKLGMKLTAEAAYLLISCVGKDPAELHAELIRLAPELTGKASLGPDALRGKLTIGFESTPFEFADAVLAKDRKRALRSLEAMFARGVRGRDGGSMDAGGVFPFTVSWLWTAMSNAHAGCALVDEGVRLDDVAARVGVRTFADRYRAQVAANREPSLRRGLLLLLEAQRELRSTGEDPRAILERFVARHLGEGGR